MFKKCFFFLFFFLGTIHSFLESEHFIMQPVRNYFLYKKSSYCLSVFSAFAVALMYILLGIKNLANLGNLEYYDFNLFNLCYPLLRELQ